MGCCLHCNRKQNKIVFFIELFNISHLTYCTVPNNTYILLSSKQSNQGYTRRSKLQQPEGFAKQVRSGIKYSCLSPPNLLQSLHPYPLADSVLTLKQKPFLRDSVVVKLLQHFLFWTATNNTAVRLAYGCFKFPDESVKCCHSGSDVQ